MTWIDETRWESDWWDTCQNTFGEEEKQLTYARKMGLKAFHDGKSPYNFDLEGKSVLDIGGGPSSLLLKCHNVKGTVIDPCDYPEWTESRYKASGIRFYKTKGEEIEESGYDEVWIYNVLQHTEVPERVIKNARKAGNLIRIFEWIDTYVAPGHPHVLTEEKLNEWLKGEGKVEVLDLPTLKGKCFYGIFPTKV